jgi:hypothetical protein
MITDQVVTGTNLLRPYGTSRQYRAHARVACLTELQNFWSHASLLWSVHSQGSQVTHKGSTTNCTRIRAAISSLGRQNIFFQLP